MEIDTLWEGYPLVLDLVCRSLLILILGIFEYRFDISIETTSRAKFVLNVENSDRVIDIKRKIREETGLPIEKQLLKLNGTVLADDSERVSHLNIPISDCIQVLVLSKTTIRIITVNEETVPLEVFISDRIIDMKKKIQEKTRIPMEDQILLIRQITQGDDTETFDKSDTPGKNDIFVTLLFKDGKRGVCLVINNEAAESDTPPRPGTNVDEENIVYTFESMGYKTLVHRNVRDGDMERILRETKNSAQSSHQMLIVFVLSHGAKEGFITSDGRVYPTKDILDTFSNQNFPTLSGKPKVFYFVCCRGTEKSRGLGAASNQGPESGGPRPSRTVYPEMVDMFIGYASYEDYPSREGGSYVRHMCNTIDHHHEWSVADIHQEVQSRVSKEDIHHDHWFQRPFCVNMLADPAFFIKASL